MQESDFIQINIQCVEKSWRKIEKEFFKRMNKMMKKPFDKDIIAYLTTAGICPYDKDEPSFMVSFYYPYQAN